MKRYDIINTLIEKHGYKSYLEIGFATGETHTKIDIEHKESVDPAGSGATHAMTSDEFFKQNKEKYDIIFIDGLHHSDQVDKDIKNSLKFLNKGGTIVMHDCNPTSELMQRVPRETGVWTGDCWKSFVRFLANNHNGYECFVIDSDWGCGVIREGESELKFILDDEDSLNYEWLDQNRKEVLNLISVQEFLEIC